jgi:hypothetical protein
MSEKRHGSCCEYHRWGGPSDLCIEEPAPPAEPAPEVDMSGLNKLRGNDPAREARVTEYVRRLDAGEDIDPPAQGEKVPEGGGSYVGLSETWQRCVVRIEHLAAQRPDERYTDNESLLLGALSDLAASQRVIEEITKTKSQLWDDYQSLRIARDAAIAERDEARASVSLMSDWVVGEMIKHENRSAGGQQVGDSHSPRVPVSALRELERLLSKSQATYTHGYFIKLEAERDAAIRERDALRSTCPYCGGHLDTGTGICEYGDECPGNLATADKLRAELADTKEAFRVAEAEATKWHIEVKSLLRQCAWIKLQVGLTDTEQSAVDQARAALAGTKP